MKPVPFTGGVLVGVGLLYAHMAHNNWGFAAAVFGTVIAFFDSSILLKKKG